MHRRHHLGFGRLDLLAIAGCGSALLALTTAVIGGGNGARTAALTQRDMTQLRDIHGAMSIFAQESGEGDLPRPGVIDRVGAIPGRGEEDASANTTANLYSSLIMQRYVAVEQVVSPVERNPKVAPDADYDFDLYDPGKDTYWDAAFTADLATGSNASYAHQVLWGERLPKWSSRAEAGWVHLGNRGPEAGERDARSHTCGPHGHWAGSVAFADGHVELLTAMSTPRLRFGPEGRRSPDNLFAMEDGLAGADAILSFTKTMNDDGPALQFD